MCGGIVLAILLAFLLGPYVLLDVDRVEVGQDEVGVHFSVLTGELGDPLYPGAYVINPVIEEITIYSTATQQLHIAPDGNLQARTRDGQVILLTAELTYSLDPAEVNIVYSHWRDRYQDHFISPILRGLIRDVISDYEIADILEDISAIEQEIRTPLQERLAEEGFIFGSLDIEVVQPE